ncbi:MAG: hypothetical protein IJ187_01430 [Neisseriaceae bacterium]|nr:hypothetical protein [Neisseriaceae bacterium]MBQ9258501.1 hypothetical protein [Neisseriaceae bacterium]MBQ9724898.1 hypothetical protein [Neisseriaceae bacterium]
MINILLGLLIIVAVLLSLWAMQIKRKHGGGCGGCGTGCGNTCGGCGSSCLTEQKDEKE